MRAGYIGGLVNRKGYIQIRNFLVRVVLKGGLYLRAGSVTGTGFTVYERINKRHKMSYFNKQNT